MNYPPRTPARGSAKLQGTPLVVLISIVAALGGLLFGYDTGIISVALLGLKQEFAMGAQTQEWVTSAIVAGALLGCLGTGPISDSLGRRRATALVGLVFVIGSLLSALAPSVAVLVMARLLLGLATGSASQIIPVYIAEVTPPHRRGALVAMFQFMVVLGICFAYLWGYLLGDAWRWMFFLGVIPATILMLGMLILPESPRWLLSKQREAEALAILRRVRGDEREATKELHEIQAIARQPQGGWRELRKPWLRPALVVGVGIAMFSQITGNNAIIYYAPTILSNAGFSHRAAILAPAGGAIAITLATLIGSQVVDRVGRRRYLLRLIPGSIISLVLLGWLVMDGQSALSGNEQILIAACLILYQGFNAGAFGVCIWLIISEVFPLYVRGKGASIGAFSHWGFNLLVSLTTLSMIERIGLGYAMWVYAGISLLAMLFVYFLVPETAGHSLEQIEADLRRQRFYPFQHRTTKSAAEEPPPA